MAGESQLKTSIRKMLLKRGAYYSNPKGGEYSKDGDPDIIVCYRGRFIGIEAKNPNRRGKLRESQKDCKEYVLEAGGRYVVATSLQDVETVLDEIDEDEEIRQWLNGRRRD